MKNKIILAGILLFTYHFSFAQLRYVGLKVEGSSVLTQLSNDTKINQPFAKSIGFAGHYPINPQTEVVSDFLFSTYKLTGDSRSFDPSNNEWSNNGIKAFNIKSIDAAFGIQRGFGEEQHFKIGVGGFYHLFLSRLGALPINEFLGKSANVNENYDPFYLYARPNYGFLIEGIYNINDAFHIGIRFKKGLSNLYKPQGNDISWKQSRIGIGVMYYLGAGERGKIISKKSSKTKSKINF